jgi:hypothetical protein
VKVKKGQKVVRINAIGQVGTLPLIVCTSPCKCISNVSPTTVSCWLLAWLAHCLVTLAAGAPMVSKDHMLMLC